MVRGEEKKKKKSPIYESLPRNFWATVLSMIPRRVMSPMLEFSPQILNQLEKVSKRVSQCVENNWLYIEES